MSEIYGIDLGNANVKTDSGIIFENRMKNGITKMNKEDIQVIHEGNGFTFGTEDGALNIGKNKFKKLHYKLALLTAIAKSNPHDMIKCKVVVGIPIEPFNNEQLKETIKKNIKSFRNEQIILNNRNVTITIEDADVFCESGIVYSDRKRFRNEKTLVIDLGGSTVDISLWDGLRLAKYRTYKEGMFTLYENIIKAVNDRNGTDLSPSESRYIMGKDKYTINQKSEDVKYVSGIVETYTNGLTSYINQYFPYDSVDSIQLIGGGAVGLSGLLKDEYENAELCKDTETINAKTFKEVGEMIWLK